MSERQIQSFPEPPLLGNEVDTLLGSLERQRATFGWKCEGLDDDQMTQRLGTSTLSIGRLLKHLAYMEDINFTRDLAGDSLPAPWCDIDAGTRSAWVFTSADADSSTFLFSLWSAATDRSRRAVRRTLDGADLSLTYEIGGDSRASVRRLLVDMIEEYGRHTGHADLIREAIDGRVGEDPPGSPTPYSH